MREHIIQEKKAWARSRSKVITNLLLALNVCTDAKAGGFLLAFTSLIISIGSGHLTVIMTSLIWLFNSAKYFKSLNWFIQFVITAELQSSQEPMYYIIRVLREPVNVAL